MQSQAPHATQASPLLFALMQYPISPQPPTSTSQPSTATPLQVGPATPSPPLVSQYHALTGTPTPSSAAVTSPQQLEKAIFAPLIQKLKKSPVPMTYDEETDDAEIYIYPFKDEALTTPYHPRELPSLWRSSACPPITCFCPAAGATYAQSYDVRVFKCANGNPQWDGVWISGCAQRRCGFWLPFGLDGVPTTEMDFFVRAGAQLQGFHCPVPSTSGLTPTPNRIPSSNPQHQFPSLTTFALNGMEGFACPNIGGGTLIGMGPSSANPPLVSPPSAPSSSAKPPKAAKGKAKSKATNSSMDLATMLSQIPNLGEIVANALGHQGINIGGDTDSAITNYAPTTSPATIDRSPTPEYVRLPAGPNIGPMGLPIRTPSRRGANHQGPYSRNGTPSSVIARESAASSEIGKRIDGLFRTFNTEPPVERVGHAMAFYFQMNDDDFPGVTPRQFTDTFWQCAHCKRILTIWRIKAHQARCSAPFTDED